MSDKWRVEVDRSVCIGSGMCVGGAPHDFTLDSGRKSYPVHEVTDSSEAIMDAAESCPVEAITIVDAETGEAVFPPEE